jgi:hypothetical protein
MSVNRTMNDKQQAYEQRVASLVGEVISRVVYHTYADDEGKPYYDHYEKFHHLDQGLILHTDSGKVFSIIWGSEFTQYGLDFLAEDFTALGQSPGDSDLWDMTTHEKWQPFVGRKITAFEVLWAWEGYLPDRIDYPQDLIFTFDHARKLYLSASYSHVTHGDYLAGMADEVIVIFDETIAKTHLLMLKNS